MQKEFSKVTLDKIYYQGELVHNLVAILIGGEYKTVKLNNEGSKSVKFLVTHEESAKICELLLDKFNSICEFNIQLVPIPNVALQQIRFIQKYDICPLSQFKGFNGLIDNNVKISIIVDNNYELEGQLEISLALSFNEGRIVVFDKWSTWLSKKSFHDIEVKVDSGINNFFQRDSLLFKLVNSAYTDFSRSIDELRVFLFEARKFKLNGETLKAVYLDLKDRNRSLTSLNLSFENKEKIKNDLSKVNKFISQTNKEGFCYVDFIRIIAKSPPLFQYNPLFEFEITTSRAYNSLLKKQKIFSVQEKKRIEYENEQLQTLINIESMITD
jgi:hypothetical protein